MTDWNAISSIATATGSVLTGFGVAFGAWQIRLAKKQSQAEFEDHLDQQYRKISMELPVDVLIGKEVRPEDCKRVRELIYNYFDLTNEQVYLRAKQRITRYTWKSWCSGMQAHLSRPAFKHVYDELISQTDFTYFERLVESNFKSDPNTWF